MLCVFIHFQFLSVSTNLSGVFIGVRITVLYKNVDVKFVIVV